MSDPTSAYVTIVEELIARHGPADRLTMLDRSIIEICASTLANMKAGDPGDASKVASTVAMLIGTLPAPLVADDDPWDITKLSDAQLAALDDINVTARSRDRPSWTPPEPEAERPMGECEREAIKLGVYLDQHRDQWRGRALTENERIDVMNFLTNIGCAANTILRNVFKPIFDSELMSAVSRAILSTEDRMMKAAEGKSKSANLPAPAPEREASSGTNVFDLPLPRVRDYGDNET